MKQVISRLASDCDQRNRFIRAVPGVFDKYVAADGRLMTEEDFNQVNAFRIIWDGLDFVANRIRA